jgi:HK97 family phage portal protein
VKRAYNAVGHMRRAVALRSNAIAEMPRHWYSTSDGSEIQEDDLPWAGDFSDMLWRLESSLCVAGAAYLYRVLAGQKLASLRWFASSTITLKANSETGALLFERTIDSRKDVYTADQVAYVWQPDPFVEIGPGIAPAATALINAGVIQSIAQYSSAFFERGAISPTILTFSGNPPKDERDRLKTWWKRVVTGMRNAFTTEVLIGGGIEVNTLGAPTKDLAMPELSKQHKEDLATAMGIPYSMLFSDAANYATAQQDVKSFYDATVLPQSNIIQTALNDQLFAPLGVELYFAPEELPVYQDDESDRATSLSALVAAGMPLDVALDTLGYDLDDEYETRIRYAALSGSGMNYDAARAIILAEEEQPIAPAILAVLEALRPAPVAPVVVTTPAPTFSPPDTTAPQPAPVMPMRSALAVDLGKWERKAAKALGAGKPAAVSFDSEAISPALAAAIGGALESATDADAVRRVFRDAVKRDSQAFYEQPIPAGAAPSPRITVNVSAPVVNVSNQMPEQAPPTVNVAPAVVNVASAELKLPVQPAPVVNVAAPNVTIEAPAQPAPIVNVNVPRIAREDQVVTRDRDGNLKGSTTTVTYEGDK